VLPGYATENDLFGVPLSRLFKVACAGSAILAGASIAGNVVMGLEAGLLQMSASKAAEERDLVQRQINDTLTSNMRQLAATVSVDHDSAISAAKAVWHPNSVTTIECTTISCVVQLSVGATRQDSPIAGDGTQGLISQGVDESVIRDVLAQHAPQGYRETEVAITGDGNVVTVTFEQQKPDSPVRSLLPH
jgi:hypothetical protein